ncbi:hypothetical protein [Elioraea rosea]|uniref:hypothetical protein n=1 Tax=Elioraea rosea TaxID=2492390 RepID=UPI0011820D5C|nr:hypothetical protein [Elioraea rosea]
MAALLLAACLAAGGARADDQRAQTRAALNALEQATVALERGDTGEAAFLLAYMSDSVKALNATAQRYRETARAAEQQCQARSVALISAIETNHARQQELERQDEQLGAEIRVQREQVENYLAGQGPLGARAREIREEIHFTALCINDNGFYYDTRNFGRCFVKVWESRTSTRIGQLNDELNDLSRRYMALQNAINAAEEKQRMLQSELAVHRTETAELRAQRAGLEQQDRAVRLAVVALSDVTVFWDKALSLLGVNVANRLGLLKDLLPTLDVTSHVPVFDDYDRSEIRSLRATLHDFATSVDERDNFLLAPAICQ